LGLFKDPREEKNVSKPYSVPIKEQLTINLQAVEYSGVILPFIRRGPLKVKQFLLAPFTRTIFKISKKEVLQNDEGLEKKQREGNKKQNKNFGL